MPGRDLRTVTPSYAAALVAAMVALAFKIAVPMGFMFAPDRAFELVVCTQNGLASVTAHEDAGHGDKDPAKPQADGACAFAGHAGGWVGPAAPAPVIVGYAVDAGPERVAAADLAPGRGLAAPPPPTRGPPQTV